MNDNSRLDRIETLVEKIGQRVDSNARAIEALSVNTAEYQRDRVQLYQLMADLAQAEAETKREMYRMISNLDRRQDELSRRQAEIVEIIKLLTQK